MVKFAQDISASINFIKNKPTVEKDNVFLIGLSIGGAASIYAAAADYRIKKIVTIGTPSNPAQVMTMHMRKKRIPQPIIWAAFKIMEFRIGKRFTQLASANNVSKTNAQILLIHGTNDKVVPFSQAKIIIDAANKDQIKLWAIDGKGHSNCHYEHGFWDNIIEFLRQ
jgi:esterase/lipase